MKKEVVRSSIKIKKNLIRKIKSVKKKLKNVKTFLTTNKRKKNKKN